MIPVTGTGGPLVLAHRGGGEEAPENTLVAFQHAVDLGVTHIETDVQVTSDGQVVISHDPTLQRRFGEKGKIGDHTYAELLELRDEDGEHLPLLSEVLELFPKTWFNIDAKTDAVVDPLLELLEEKDAGGRVMLASFSEKRLERIRARGIPDLSTSLGVSAIVRLLLASETVSSAQSWHVPGPEQGVTAAQVPEKNKGVRVVSPRFIATAHTAGLAVHVWTVNEREQMERLVDWGVDGIVTDKPSLLIEVLQERGMWHRTQ